MGIVYLLMWLTAALAGVFGAAIFWLVHDFMMKRRLSKQFLAVLGGVSFPFLVPLWLAAETSSSKDLRQEASMFLYYYGLPVVICLFIFSRVVSKLQGRFDNER